MKISISITIFVLLLAIVGIYLISQKKFVNIGDAEKVNGIITIVACAGGLISATFAIWGFMQSNHINKEGQRPQLLIFVKNLTLDENHGGPLPVTEIHYQNITTNSFCNLNISPVIKTENREIDLSDVFHKDMIMIGRDARSKKIYLFKETEERGFFLSNIGNEDPTAYLELSYSYKFYNKEYKVLAQKYIWRSERREWEIY